MMVKILAIDDNNDNLIILEALLSDAFPDAKLFFEMSGESGMEMCFSVKPDLILLDIVMPGMDGFEVCRKIKSNDKVMHIPIIMLTAAQTDKASRIKALEMGAEAFIAKPIDDAELTAQVRTMLRLKESEDRRRDEAVRLSQLVTERTKDLERELTERKKVERELSALIEKLEKSKLASLNLMEDLKDEIEERKHAEEALKHSHNLMSYIIEHNRSAIAVHDRDLNYIYVSQRYKDEYKITDPDIIGKHHYEVFPDLPQKWRDVHQKALMGEISSAENDPFYREDGSIEWTRWECRPWYESDGSTGGIIVYTEVITERKKAELEILSQRNVLNAIYDSSPNIIALLDKEARIININRVGKEFARKELIFNELCGYVFNCLNSFHQSGCGQSPECSNCPVRSSVNKTFDTKKPSLNYEDTMSFVTDGNPIKMDLLISTNIVQYQESDYVLLTIVDITERKKAEDELKETKERYENFISQVTEGVYRFEFEMPMPLSLTVEDQINHMYNHMFIEECNPSFMNMYGISDLKDIIGKTQKDLHGGDDNPVNRKAMSDFINSGYRTQNIVTEEIDANGERKFFSNNAVGIIEDGHLTRMWGTQTDITEQKIAEEALKESEEKYRYMFENNPQPMWIYDFDSLQILEVNKSAIRHYGYSKDEFLSMTIKDIRPTEDIGLMLEDVELSRKQDNPTNVWRHLKKNGEVIFVEVSALSINFNTRPARHVLINDITARKKAELELLENKNKFESIFNLSPYAIVISNIQTGLYVDVNESFEKITGYTRTEAIGKKSTDLGFWLSSDGRNKWFTELSQKGFVENLEIQYRCKPGNVIFCQVSSRIIELVGEKYNLSIIQNISERKAAETALIESEEKFRNLITQMQLGMAVHEIILDEKGAPVDYRFLDVNPSFERLTGLKREIVLGKTVREIIPGVENYWIQKYGNVALSGEPLSYENYSSDLEKYFSVVAYRPKEMQFAVIMEDITERKKGEEALAKSEEQLRLLLTNIRDVVYSVDVKSGEFKFLSPSFEIMTGYNSEDILSAGGRKNFLKNVISEEKLIEWDDKLKNLGQDDIKTGFLHEIWWLCKNGEKKYLQDSWVPVYKDGELISTDGVLTDITERKNAEDALRESEKRFRILVESAPEAIYVQSQYIFVYLNSAALKLFGARRQSQLLGKSVFDRIHPDYVDVLRRRLKTTSANIENSAELVKKYIKFDGTEIDVEVSAVSISYMNKDGALVFVHDITDKVKKDRELEQYRLHLEEIVDERTYQVKQQNVFLRTFIDSVPNPIFIKNADGKFSEVNLAFEKFFGLSREEIIGKSIAQITSKEAAKQHIEIDRQLLVNRSMTIYESYHINKDRKKIPVMVYKVSFGESDTNIKGIAGHYIDISAQKEMEEKTAEALKKEKELNEMKTSFISSASHEFRTPLTTILGSADLLEINFKRWDDDRINKHIGKIQNSVAFMLSVLDEVLTISRSERGKMTFNPEYINLMRLCNEIIEDIRLHDTKKHKIKYEYNSSVAELHADPKLIRHILSNLLSNAVKFSPGGGEVKLAVDQKKEFIIFEISDSGIGIPESEIKKLFEPFYRASNVGDLKGSGLGLSIVKNCVEEHKGEISVKSKIDKGTTFTVKLKVGL